MSYPKYAIGEEVQWKSCGISKYDAPPFKGFKKVIQHVRRTHANGRIKYKIQGMPKLYTTQNLDSPGLPLERRILKAIDDNDTL